MTSKGPFRPDGLAASPSIKETESSTRSSAARCRAAFEKWDIVDAGAVRAELLCKQAEHFPLARCEVQIGVLPSMRQMSPSKSTLSTDSGFMIRYVDSEIS